MSLLPILFNDALMGHCWPSRLLNQQFGNFVPPEDFIMPFTNGYFRPWRTSAAAKDSGSAVAIDKDKFQVNLDVQQFRPEEITVKVTGNKEITIEGKHEEKQDEHGYISRHFVRRYVVPDCYDMDRIVSNLSSDGVLSITAPNAQASPSEHKEIPINQTGKPAIENNEK